MKRFATIFRLAWADYFNEALLSACSILALAAAMLPLLVILGVQQGLVGALTERLLSDPRNLEVRPAGMGQFEAGWIERLKNEPGVAFIVPQTRSISAQLELFPYSDDENAPKRALKVDLIPSASGDPLLGHWSASTHGAPAARANLVLSANAARKLGLNLEALAQGEEAKIKARVSRRLNNKYEQEFFSLQVQGILPLEAEQKDAAYAQFDLLQDVETYRDGRAVAYFNWPGQAGEDARQVFTSFRLYASNLDAVEKLSALLENQGIDTYTRAEEIASVRNLNQAFSFLSILLLSVVGGGFLASAISSSLAQVNRKQRSLGVLRLLGFKSKQLALFPLIQALLTGIAGSTLALALLYGVQIIINRAFASQVMAGEKICNLSPSYAGAALALACLLMLSGALVASHKITRIDPSQLIREI